MLHRALRELLLTCLFCLLVVPTATDQAQQEHAVRAVLFYSPTCPHCHQVINELLVPMVEEHGDALQILAVDVSQSGGQDLYQAAVAHFQIPEERLGVPTLIVGEIVLVGSVEIPTRFPAIVNDGLASGIDWPAIPGLAESVVSPTDSAKSETGSAATPEATAVPEATYTPAVAIGSEFDLASEEPPTTTVDQQGLMTSAGDAAPSVLDAEQLETSLDGSEEPPADPLGFALAAAILIAMVVATAFAAYRLAILALAWRQSGPNIFVVNLSWAIPLMAFLGIGVSVYLAYVELNQVEVVCGPVGHCNLVQSSPYARIMGVPIAVLGIGTYLAIIGLWIAHRFGSQEWGKWTLPGLVGLTIFGTVFSIYLTLLELFVIRAVCAWCLTSAVTMATLMLLVVRPLTPGCELVVR